MQEIEARYVLPALRRALAIELLNAGKKNVEIAEMFGMTKSAISQYFKKSRGKEFSFSLKAEKEIKKAAQRIVKGERAILEVQKLLNFVKENREICRFHHSKEKLHGGCDICFN